MCEVVADQPLEVASFTASVTSLLVSKPRYTTCEGSEV
jgi:hypothetical protein